MENQRLFRLTSQSNDGVFNTLFNEDIEIAPGSEIALQSAAFERQSARIILDNTNNELKFSLLANKRYTGRLPTGTFTQLQDGEDLLAAAAKEMNLVTNMEATTGQTTVGGFVYSIDRGSQWRAQLDSDGKTEVTAKTNEPVLVSTEWREAYPDEFVKTTQLAGIDPPTINPGNGGNESQWMQRSTTATVPASYNESYVYGKVRMVKGTGCIRTRLYEIGDTTIGPDITATIGLVTDYSKLTSGTIADADIIWGLQIAGNDTNYRFKQGGGTAVWQDAGVQPEQSSESGSADNDNDVLEIVLTGKAALSYRDGGGGQSVEMNIHRSGNAVTKLPLTPDTTLFQDVDYYYFISFHKPAADIKLDMVEADLDPYLFDLTTFQAEQISTIPTVIRSGFDNSIPADSRSARFNVANAEVGAFFGFLPGKPVRIPSTDDSDGFIQSSLYRFTSETRAEFSVRAKNYLVLFDELPLNSYDSYARFDVNARNANSGGSRRNLLATVPVKEDQLANTGVSQVAFEPNTLDYISLRNNSTFLTRTLGCRILTSTYQPIVIDGMASLTLLIKQHCKGSCG